MGGKRFFFRSIYRFIPQSEALLFSLLVAVLYPNLHYILTISNTWN